jgi:ABC-type uncharacterized transport system permease subunit
MALLGTMRSPWLGVVLAGLALACIAASEALWRIALRRYSSASA